MSKQKEESLASYIGITGPETPKYLLVNNFLADFFMVDQPNRGKQFTYEDFQKAGILICEEDNELKKQQLETSFNRFFQHFSGEDMIRTTRYKNQYFYFPIKPSMLRSSTMSLRHLLFNMLLDMEKPGRFREIQDQLMDYLYGATSGVDYLFSELCAKLSEQTVSDSVQVSGRKNQEFDYLRRKPFRIICENFERDLQCLLTHRFFKELDFYRRYDYLATLLNSYVIQFILKRSAENGGKGRGYILCQGSASSHLLERGEFHRACVQNYAEIRSMFPRKLKEFYVKRLEERFGKDERIEIRSKGDELYVKDIASEITFIKLVQQAFNSSFRSGQSLYPVIRKVFKIDEEDKEYKFTIDEFAMYYIDATKARRGSTLTKISSTLPTVGKDIEFVFPKSQSRHKFFAMSPALLEFYVRLYLAKVDRSYAYLDNFLQYMEDDYHICLVKSKNMDDVLKKLQIRVSFQEFRLNEQALLENLEAINCLVRLSDSGYVIALPEEKGEFQLL